MKSLIKKTCVAITLLTLTCASHASLQPAAPHTSSTLNKAIQTPAKSNKVKSLATSIYHLATIKSSDLILQTSIDRCSPYPLCKFMSVNNPKS